MSGGTWLSCRRLNTCLMMGSGELIPCSTFLMHAVFPFPIKLALSQYMNFLISTLPVLSPITLGRVNEQLHETEFPAGIKP